MDQQMTHKEQLEWWIEWYRRTPSVARTYIWSRLDMASGKVVTKVGARGPIPAVAGHGGEHSKVLEYNVPPQVGDVVKVSPEVESSWLEWAKDILRQDAPELPKPLPNGATRHKALPAACLDRMDDRAAFIGRWEQ